MHDVWPDPLYGVAGSPIPSTPFWLDVVGVLSGGTLTLFTQPVPQSSAHVLSA